MVKQIEPGTVFGHLKVNGHPGSNKHGQAMYACTCECVKTVIVPGYKLRRGEAKSCGCKRAALRMATMQASETKTAGSTSDVPPCEAGAVATNGAAAGICSDQTLCTASNAATVGVANK
jgi:hypothetical protein